MQIRNSHSCHISYCAQIQWGKLLMLREKQTSSLLRNSGRNKRLRYNGLRISATDSWWFVCVDLNVLLAELLSVCLFTYRLTFIFRCIFVNFLYYYSYVCLCILYNCDPFITHSGQYPFQRCIYFIFLHLVTLCSHIRVYSLTTNRMFAVQTPNGMVGHLFSRQLFSERL